MLNPDIDHAMWNHSSAWPSTDLLNGSRQTENRDHQADTAGSSLGKHRRQDSDTHPANSISRICLGDTAQSRYEQIGKTR